MEEGISLWAKIGDSFETRLQNSQVRKRFIKGLFTNGIDDHLVYFIFVAAARENNVIKKFFRTVAT